MPYGVKLVCNIRGAGAISNEGLDLFKLALVSILESRGIMKNEFWIAGEGERAPDIMDPTLIEGT